MPHLVADKMAAPVATEAPVVLLKEVLVAVLGRPRGGLVAVHFDAVVPSPPEKAALCEHLGGALLYAALDGGDQVGFVIEGAGKPRDKGLRNQLAHEDDAPASAIRHIEAQVDLREITGPRPGHSPHARVDEVDGDEAREGAAVARVEAQSGGQVGL